MQSNIGGSEETFDRWRHSPPFALASPQPTTKVFERLHARYLAANEARKRAYSLVRPS